MVEPLPNSLSMKLLISSIFSEAIDTLYFILKPDIILSISTEFKTTSIIPYIPILGPNISHAQIVINPSQRSNPFAKDRCVYFSIILPSISVPPVDAPLLSTSTIPIAPIITPKSKLINKSSIIGAFM